VNIVIVGARERRETEADKVKVEMIITDLKKEHGTRLHILSTGCDKGIGKLSRNFCLMNKIKFVEVRVKVEGEDISRVFFAHMFLARNTALLEVGDEYFIFKGPNENGIIESIIAPAQRRVGAERVKTFEMEG
jgi:hypothetical protein